jgi:type III pantothenate kinase
MQSGLFYGYVGLVDGILARLLADYPGSRVLATGGLAKVIAPSSRYIQDIAVDLTLEGLRILWLKNRKPAP